MVVAADDFAANPASPGRNGTPILFPFPNRIRDGKYTFGGKSYEIPAGGKADAIHGFAIAANWDVVDHGATADEAFIVGRFHLATHAPEMLAHWPTDAILTVRYGLSGRRLTMSDHRRQPDRPGPALRLRHPPLLPAPVRLEGPGAGPG